MSFQLWTEMEVLRQNLSLTTNSLSQRTTFQKLGLFQLCKQILIGDRVLLVAFKISSKPDLQNPNFQHGINLNLQQNIGAIHDVKEMIHNTLGNARICKVQKHDSLH